MQQRNCEKKSQSVWISGGLGLGVQGKQVVAANGYAISFCGNENVLKLIVVEGNILKSFELYTLSG